jgi:hypothetical protein
MNIAVCIIFLLSVEIVEAVVLYSRINTANVPIQIVG